MSPLDDLRRLIAEKREADPAHPDLPTLIGAANAILEQTARAVNAEERVARYEPVLAWYGDPGNYIRVPPSTQISVDKGARARAVMPAAES